MPSGCVASRSPHILPQAEPEAREGWRERTPESSGFTLKAPERITHVAKLAGVGEIARAFFRSGTDASGPRLELHAVQCRRGCDTSESPRRFLGALPGDGLRFAMEFRHASWDTRGEGQLVENTSRGATSKAEDSGTASSRRRGILSISATTPGYDEALLGAWDHQVAAHACRRADVYLYFKHEGRSRGVTYAAGACSEEPPIRVRVALARKWASAASKNADLDRRDRRGERRVRVGLDALRISRSSSSRRIRDGASRSISER